jgi:phosphoheptose isomerase
MNEVLPTFKLLITIVNSGMGRKVVKASKEAGAEGGTTMLGKGTGTHEIKSIFGIPIETEKETSSRAFTAVSP